MALTTPRFWRGWIATLVAGVVFFGWIIRYTDQFETVIGVFSLGGVLAWLTFFSQALPKAVIEEMQTRIYEDYFRSGRAAKVGLSVVALVGLGGTFWGSIAVEAPTASRQMVWIRSPGEGLGVPAKLPEGGEAFKQLVFTTPWTASERLVKVPGYPYVTQTVSPFQRKWIRFPDALGERHVILLQPRPSVSLVRFREPRTLLVDLEDQSYKIPEFRGEPLWIGCLSDVALPALLQRRLRREVAASFPSAGEEAARREFETSISDFWLSPQSVHELAANENEEALRLPPPLKPDMQPVVSMEFRSNVRGNEIRNYTLTKEKIYDFVELWWMEPKSN